MTVIKAQCKNLKKKGKSAMRKGCLNVHVYMCMCNFTIDTMSLVCKFMRIRSNRTAQGSISGFKVAFKAKFTVEVYSTTSTLHLSDRVKIIVKCPFLAS